MPNITQYTLEQKQEAAILYATVGSYAQVAKQLDIPKPTVWQWSRKWDEWDNLVKQVQTEKADEHRAMYARIVDEAQAITLAKLPEATAAQANIIAATATDKVRLLDGQATTISSKVETIGSLSEQFQRLAADIKAKTVQVIDVTPDKDGGGGK